MNRERNALLRGFAGATALAVALGACRKAPPPESEAPDLPVVYSDTVSASVKAGQTLESILRNLDLAEDEFRALLQQARKHLRRIHVGQTFHAVFRRGDGPMHLQGFALQARSGDRVHRLDLARDSTVGPSFRYLEDTLHLRVDTAVVAGVLRSSLYESFLALGEGPALVDAMAKVFAWDVDFFRDPRESDAFRVLVEKRYTESGRFVGYGNVLAARYENRGRDFGAVLYRGRFFSPDGRSLEKQLMKAPLRFSARISSGFNRRRLHPVLGVHRPHWGVDYAGPVGTPILAAGSGTVVYAKWVNGYGKTVKIRHNGVYNSYYAHLNGYARGIGTGRRVVQGQVIGYLGNTGMSTGPHLDYRVEKNGRYIDPARMVSEPLQGIADSERAAFLAHCDLVFARLGGSDTGVRVARAAADSARGGS